MMDECEFRKRDDRPANRRIEILENNISLFKQRLKKPEWKKEKQKLKYEISMMEKEVSELRGKV